MGGLVQTAAGWQHRIHRRGHRIEIRHHLDLCRHRQSGTHHVDLNRVQSTNLNAFESVVTAKLNANRRRALAGIDQAWDSAVASASKLPLRNIAVCVLLLKTIFYINPVVTE